MKQMIPVFVIVLLAGTRGQSTGHPFDASAINSSIDSFVVVTGVTTPRTVGHVVQTIARERGAIRLAVDYNLGATMQRVEMVMDGNSLAPMAHWESLIRRGLGETRGEMQFRDGRARGVYILSKGVVDVPIDTGVVDDDASTALLAALPLDTGRTFTFRTFASPGRVEVTRVQVAGIETVTVPAGRFETWRLTVMARDTSNVFVSTGIRRRVVLVRLSDGSQEMRLVNKR
jgi:hypothetical protein